MMKFYHPNWLLFARLTNKNSAVISLLLVGLLLWPTGSMAAALKMPTFTVPGVNISGNIVSSAYQGKVLVVNFWATWCPSCRKEIKSFVRLSRDYADKDFAIIGISVDKRGQEVVGKYIKKMAIPYPVAMNTKELKAGFGPIIGIPATFIVDRRGVIVKKRFGYMPHKQLVAIIDELLSK